MDELTTDLNTDGLVLWFDDLGSGDHVNTFLSNFYESPFPALGSVWPTGEHLFQACKYTHDPVHYDRILRAAGPAEAKALGRSLEHPLRDDWESVKYDVMAAVVRLKFASGSVLARRLLRTGDKALVEGTYWRDEVWGVDLNYRARPGRNWLGTLLMARRTELRAGLEFETATWNVEFFSELLA